MRNGGRRRNAARSAEMNGGGWRGAGAGDVQVGGASHRERRWGLGVNERALTMNGCGWGGGRKEEETNNPENVRRKRWGRRARLKLLIISNERLGTEG